MGVLQMNQMVEIVAVCDVYDALIAPRPYRPVCYENRAALEEITGMAERGEISWDVLKALVACNRKEKPHFRTLTISTDRRGSPPPDNAYGIRAKDDSMEGGDE
jgi:HD-GYP domain-containing protein (c-di-GMP phosphodiesterase class II)